MQMVNLKLLQKYLMSMPGNINRTLKVQELLAFQYHSLSLLHFWERENESTAEVDYLYPYDG